MLDDDSQQIINTRRKQKQPSSLLGIRFRTCVWVPGSVRIPHWRFEVATNNRHATRIHSLDVVTAANSNDPDGAISD
ncbi:hypothetical protein DAPPUDRAFT_255656 [Daphnia pulex]|uniref:Uncharacterized protein n=1 Tax=Daphnia pulex TaxID=6669 RepID=E9H9T9_DAPPU|nr:hypothetical protein DAPPUDRAFT_255656 [Daphnia pulex]|eukprot:EFX71458.1 hypothetical protein DAPPUDRAFT_255656 [Daphnia pulex]